MKSISATRAFSKNLVGDAFAGPDLHVDASERDDRLEHRGISVRAMFVEMIPGMIVVS
jgi:hypothetical protein